MEFLLIMMLTATLYVDSTATNNCNSEDQSSEETDEPWTRSFLPKAIQPLRYDLFLSPDFYYNASVFNGTVQITFKVVDDTDTILVHAKGLSITRTAITSCHQNGSFDRAFSYDDYWVVRTNGTMRNNTCRSTLFLTFNGTLSSPSGDVFGFYKITYVNNATGKESWLVATDFQPSSSRFAFPNLDEPQFKTPFHITLRHWKNFTALSNMNISTSLNIDSVWKKTVFKATPMMSSYLVSFIITDFSHKKNKLISGKLNRVWARPDQLNKVDYALNVSRALENYLHREFNLAYPLEKLDHVALPEYSSDGAVENWGLIAYKDTTLLVDMEKDSATEKLYTLSVIAHELTHNYFGNLVTCRFWNHLWLNEGLAAFYEVEAVTAYDPALRLKETHFAEQLESMMSQDAENDADPLVPVLPQTDILRKLFNDLRYVKGPAIIRMMESFMGRGFFKSGIRRYLKNNQYKTVETSDLWAALQQDVKIPGLNLEESMNTWVYKGGIPVISVLPLCDNQFVAIQDRFIKDPLDVAEDRHLWHVPLNYLTETGNNGLVWVKKNYAIFNISLNSNDDMIQFNHDATGYYRVNYHPILFDRIIRKLNNNYQAFTEIARWKLFSDAASLVKAEHIGYDQFLSLTRYASAERGVGVWDSIYSQIYDMDYWILDATYANRFKSYVLNLTTPLMDELQVIGEGSAAIKKLRLTIISLACSAGHTGCIRNATRVFKDWIRNETHALPIDLWRNILCIGVANSVSESDWNTIFERMTSASLEDGENLVRALTCSRNVTLLERLLDYATVESKMVDELGFWAIHDTCFNPAAEGRVLKWLKLNDTRFNATKHYIATVLIGVKDAVRTRDQQQEIVDFMKNEPLLKPKGIYKYAEESKELMDKTIRKLERNSASIISWIKQNLP